MSGGSEPIDRRRDGAPIKRRCTAHRKDGGRCLRSANRGTTVCNSHGGAAGQVRRAASQRAAEDKARQACSLYSVKVDTTAEEALVYELEVAAGAVRWLRARVDEDGPGSPWWAVYSQERDYALAVAKAAAACDAQGRLVTIAKDTAAQFRLVLAEVCDRLGLTPEQRELTPGAVDEALRLILPPEDDGEDGGGGR